MHYNKKLLLVKTVGWRAIATSITLTVAYILTGQLAVAGLVAVVDTSLKTLAYYVYELYWNRSKDEDSHYNGF